MTSAAKIAAGLTGVTGTAGMGVGGLYLSSKEDIFSKVKDDILGTESEFDASWKAQFKKLSSDENVPKDLKKLKSVTGDKEQVAAIKGWCSSAYKTTYKSSFSSEQENLLKVVKKYCIQSLSEKLTDLISGNSGAKVLSTEGETDKADFTNNYKTLKDHKNTNGEKLDSSFISFNHSTAENDATTKWSELRDWCKGALTKSFKGESSDLFKTTKKFCIKSAQ
ncbi:hypothetical protein HF1_01970 [Mycoplasma haemofelis str. Langford 1]|uniref:Uncharacterized protein n=1 Tax=Mycoplasma haemofelis (strain Langford 1) TaxID=941640 RepID=E8ZKN9_MYCHL|nr:hypothetical protein [Mycoplasma haemofelis]CBY92205.1 hypothetical protein HF1_01970 [Mycoplasma haemofelis str. Langford 1]